MRKIPEDVRLAGAWSLARFGDGGWWPLVERGLRGGDLDGELVRAAAEQLRPVDWITTVPSVRLGESIERFAGRVAAELSIPHLKLVSRTEARSPQRDMANAVQQAANVRGAFRISASPPAGTGALVDDSRHSGWTLAMVAGQLRRAGAERVVALVLATV